MLQASWRERKLSPAILVVGQRDKSIEAWANVSPCPPSTTREKLVHAFRTCPRPRRSRSITMAPASRAVWSISSIVGITRSPSDSVGSLHGYSRHSAERHSVKSSICAIERLLEVYRDPRSLRCLAAHILPDHRSGLAVQGTLAPSFMFDADGFRPFRFDGTLRRPHGRPRQHRRLDSGTRRAGSRSVSADEQSVRHPVTPKHPCTNRVQQNVRGRIPIMPSRCGPPRSPGLVSPYR